MNTSIFSKYLVRRARENGGFTFDPATRTEPNTGYAVGCSRREYERHIPLSDTRACEAAVARAIANAVHGGVCVGGWAHDGKLILEYVRIWHDLTEALDAGIKWGQRAIYDLDMGREIPVPQCAMVSAETVGDATVASQYAFRVF